MSVKYAVRPDGSYRAVSPDMSLQDGETLQDVPPPLVFNVAEAIAARRYIAEVAGTYAGGLPVFTDRTTQNKLTGAALRASRDPTYTVDWKCQTGSFITLDAQRIMAVADAVGDYVQACYSREAALLAAVADGSFTDDMLEEGWPT